MHYLYKQPEMGIVTRIPRPFLDTSELLAEGDMEGALKGMVEKRVKNVGSGSEMRHNNRG